MTNKRIKEKKELLQAEVLWHLAQESYQFGSPWTCLQFQQDLASPFSQYLFVGKEPKAFLGYHQLLDEIEIFNLVVASEKQGQGLGKLLLKSLEQKAKKEQIKEIFLEVRAANHTAQNLYLSHGFEVIARRKDYYSNPKEDALIMKKKVESGRRNE